MGADEQHLAARRISALCLWLQRGADPIYTRQHHRHHRHHHHDAFNLTEKLVSVLQGGADEQVLDRYERQRRPIGEEEIIQQAHCNRTRMQERDPERRRDMLKDLQRTIDDPALLKAYLMKSSMIDGLRRAAATA